MLGASARARDLHRGLGPRSSRLRRRLGRQSLGRPVAAAAGSAAAQAPPSGPVLCRVQVSEEVLEWSIQNVYKEGDEVRPAGLLPALLRAADGRWASRTAAGAYVQALTTAVTLLHTTPTIHLADPPAPHHPRAHARGAGLACAPALPARAAAWRAVLLPSCAPVFRTAPRLASLALRHILTHTYAQVIGGIGAMDSIVTVEPDPQTDLKHVRRGGCLLLCKGESARQPRQRGGAGSGGACRPPARPTTHCLCPPSTVSLMPADHGGQGVYEAPLRHQAGLPQHRVQSVRAGGGGCPRALAGCARARCVNDSA